MSDTKKVEFLPVRDLEFDPENPRLPDRLKNDIDESKILEWMVDKGVIEELMIAIGEYGYFVGEPLLVVKKANTDDKYLVIEGNRRLAAVKLLLHPELTPRKSIQQIAADARSEKPDEIPCVIFPTRDEILRYLGYRHVTGIREWSALAKARYLAQLLPTTQEGSLDDKFQELARAIGSRKDYVARLLTGLSLYQKIEDNNFFGIQDLNEDTLSFSLLTTAASYTNIVTFLELDDPRNPDLTGLDIKRLEKLTKWIFEKENGETRIGESRNLRELNKVVAHDLARSQFESGVALTEASRLTELPDDNNTTGLFRAAVTNAKSNLETADKLLPTANNVVEYDADTLQEIQTQAGKLQVKVRVKLN